MSAPIRDRIFRRLSKRSKTITPSVGFVYICNPNNPTGAIVTKTEIKELLDGLPTEVPVLIDEAYHHFVEDPAYATSAPYVLEGRPVIVARTFSKIAALAGMRVGYGIAPANLIERMSPYTSVTEREHPGQMGRRRCAQRHGRGSERVRTDILQTRRKTTAALSAMGYAVIPSEANFFMVNLRRDVRPVIQAFRRQGVLVGRVRSRPWTRICASVWELTRKWNAL